MAVQQCWKPPYLHAIPDSNQAGTMNSSKISNTFTSSKGVSYSHCSLIAILLSPGGISVNANAEVLRSDGRVISALYANGDNTGGWMGTDHALYFYPLPGQ